MPYLKPMEVEQRSLHYWILFVKLHKAHLFVWLGQYFHAENFAKLREIILQLLATQTLKS